MGISPEIQYASVDELSLDPTNPRLGRGETGPRVSQAKVLELMKDWTLEELAVSFLESGFWVQEALMVVREPLYGEPSLVVVEGNRRLAALMYLKGAADGQPASRTWNEIVETTEIPTALFERVPYLAGC